MSTDRPSPAPPTAPRRRTALIVAGLAVVVIAGFVAAYAVFFTGDSTDRLSLSDPSGPSADRAPALGGQGPVGRWVVAEGSEAGYRVREKLARLPAQSDAVGRTTAVSGEMTVAASGDGFVARDLRMEVDLTQLRSDESRRDNRIRTQGLESDRFPKATFASAAGVAVPADAATGREFDADVEGDLTLHGVTRRVKIPVKGRLNGETLEVAGSLRFPMSMFAIDPPNIGGFVTVDPDATMEFKIALKQA